MRVYLAGPCDSDHRTLMVNVKYMIMNTFGSDIELYCPFELKIENAWSYSAEIWSKKVFDADITALKTADLVILISFGRESTAGVNFENGFAYALGKRIFTLQVTDAPTSLMTYCGCSNFYNVSQNLNELNQAIKFIANNWDESEERIFKHHCERICEFVCTSKCRYK